MLEREQTRFKLATLNLKVGSALGDVPLSVAVFVWPRGCNQRIFVSYESLYESLRLTTYKGNAYSWIDRAKGRWKPGFASELGSSQIVEGTYSSMNSTRKKLFAVGGTVLAVHSSIVDRRHLAPCDLVFEVA